MGHRLNSDYSRSGGAIIKAASINIIQSRTEGDNIMEQPIIKHNNQAKQSRKLNNVLSGVMLDVHKHIEAGHFNDLLPSNLFTGEGPDLLQLRKQLATYIKRGMLERKDSELEIVVLAGLVWYNRQSYERQQRLMDAW